MTPPRADPCTRSAARHAPGPLAAAALLLAAALAGCVAPAAEPPPASAGSPVEIVADRPDPVAGAVATGPAAEPDLGATTAAPPRLVPGEWWRIRFASSLLPDMPELVRVVAATTPAGYLLGMPHEGWFKEAIGFHVPAFGDVNADLSHDTHNVRFEPLRFPLAEGATWTTAFGATEYAATVVQADLHTATIHLDPTAEPQPTDAAFAALSPVAGPSRMVMVYDARMHEVVRFESAFVTWEVVAHGYGFQGWVTVPRGMHTAIDHGQFLAATPGQPVLTRTAAVEGGFNRLTLLQAVFALAPGVYRVEATAPDGTEYATEMVGQSGFAMRFHEATMPDGTWQLEDLVGGAGGTFSMGMAYHQYDIRLPDGSRRADHAHDVIR